MDLYPGLVIGGRKIIRQLSGRRHESTLWEYEAEVNGVVVRRVDTRKNFTRNERYWELGGRNGLAGALKAADTKRELGVVQKNSTTGITGVNYDTEHPNKLRYRRCLRNGQRINYRNLDLLKALTIKGLVEEAIERGFETKKEIEDRVSTLLNFHGKPYLVTATIRIGAEHAGEALAKAQNIFDDIGLIETEDFWLSEVKAI